MDIFQEITTLREQLQYHNRKYYDEDAPEISDYDYDMMQRKLRTLEAAHPELSLIHISCRLSRLYFLLSARLP